MSILKISGSKTKLQTIEKAENSVTVQQTSIDSGFIPYQMMSYKTFLTELAKRISIHVNDLHDIFKKSDINIDQHLNHTTINNLATGYHNFLLGKMLANTKISYEKVTTNIHPTAFTDETGNAKNKIIDTSSVGQYEDNNPPPDSYLFDEIFYDSQIELENINQNIAEIEVYTKIPKNSIRIPLVGGGTYSPDFAYVIKRKDGKEQLNLIVESKGKTAQDLSQIETQRIEYAKKFFADLGSDLNIHFTTQLSNQKIIDLIQEHQY